MCRFLQFTHNFLGLKPGFWFGVGSVVNLTGLSNQIKPKVRDFDFDQRAIKNDFDVIANDFNAIFSQSLAKYDNQKAHIKN